MPCSLAWFEAAHYGQATINTNGTSGITTKNEAEVEAMDLKIAVQIVASTAVEPTATGAVANQDEGTTYVISNGAVVPANNQSDLTKNAVGTVAVKKSASYAADCVVQKKTGTNPDTWGDLTEEDVAAFNQNQTYALTVSADNQVRVGADVEGKVNSNWDKSSYVDGSYAENAEIPLGTATITLAWDDSNDKAYVTTVTYAVDGGNAAGAVAENGGLKFYYSVSPQKTGTVKDDDNHNYGTISAHLNIPQA